MKNNRSLKNILSRPRQQLTFSILFFTCTTVLFAVFMLANLNTLRLTLANLGSEYHLPIDALEQIDHSFMLTIAATIFLGAVSVVGGAIMGLSISHRLFGPIVPIRNFIAQLKSGNFAARGSLRKNDEFQDLMKDLNELAESLEKRQSN